MSLMKYSNRPSMLSFADFFDGLAAHKSPSIKWANTPRVNVKETEEAFEIELAAPGLNKEDFKIEINEDVLTISSEQKQSSEESNGEYHRREFSYSSFSRSFTLPENVDQEQVSAVYNDGILRVGLPKMEVKSPTAKTIAVG